MSLCKHRLNGEITQCIWDVDAEDSGIVFGYSADAVSQGQLCRASVSQGQLCRASVTRAVQQGICVTTATLQSICHERLGFAHFDNQAQDCFKA